MIYSIKFDKDVKVPSKRLADILYNLDIEIESCKESDIIPHNPRISIKSDSLHLTDIILSGDSTGYDPLEIFRVECRFPLFYVNDKFSITFNDHNGDITQKLIKDFKKYGILFNNIDDIEIYKEFDALYSAMAIKYEYLFEGGDDYNPFQKLYCEYLDSDSNNKLTRFAGRLYRVNRLANKLMLRSESFRYKCHINTLTEEITFDLGCNENDIGVYYGFSESSSREDSWFHIYYDKSYDIWKPEHVKERALPLELIIRSLDPSWLLKSLVSLDELFKALEYRRNNVPRIVNKTIDIEI